MREVPQTGDDSICAARSAHDSKSTTGTSGCRCYPTPGKDDPGDLRPAVITPPKPLPALSLSTTYLHVNIHGLPTHFSVRRRVTLLLSMLVLYYTDHILSII